MQVEEKLSEDAIHEEIFKLVARLRIALASLIKCSSRTVAEMSVENEECEDFKTALVRFWQAIFRTATGQVIGAKLAITHLGRSAAYCDYADSSWELGLGNGQKVVVELDNQFQTHMCIQRRQVSVDSLSSTIRLHSFTMLEAKELLEILLAELRTISPSKQAPFFLVHQALFKKAEDINGIISDPELLDAIEHFLLDHDKLFAKEISDYDFAHYPASANLRVTSKNNVIITRLELEMNDESGDSIRFGPRLNRCDSYFPNGDCVTVMRDYAHCSAYIWLNGELVIYRNDRDAVVCNERLNHHVVARLKLLLQQLNAEVPAVPQDTGVPF